MGLSVVRHAGVVGLTFSAWIALCGGTGHSAEPKWQPLGEPGSGGWITSLCVSPHDARRVLVGGDVLGIGFSVDGGESWKPSLGLKSWEIGDFSFHPEGAKIVWAGTMSGPCLSTDGGATWQERRKGFPPIGDYHYSAPIEKVLFDPTNPRRLLAFGGSSRRMESPGKPLWGVVWESLDGGESWAKLATIGAEGSVPEGSEGRNIVGAAFAAGSSQVIFAAVDRAGVMVSRDGGKTWKPCNEGLPHTSIERVATHPKDRNTLWACLTAHKPKDEKEHLPGGIFKSTDGGRSWTGIVSGLPQVRNENINFTTQFKGFAVAPTDPEVMVVCDAAWNGCVVYRTEDGGKSWRAVARKGAGKDHPELCDIPNAYPVGYAMTVVSFDPTDAQRVFGGGAEYVLRSLDGGKRWTDTTATQVDEAGRAAGRTGLWQGCGYSGLCSVNFRFDPYRKGRSILLAMDAGKCWESTDGLRSWTFHGQEPWPWGGGNDAAFTRGERTYTTTGQFGSCAGVLRSSDAGNAWTAIKDKEHGLPEFNGQGVATGIYALPDKPDKVWAVLGGKLFHSTDGGEQWSLVPLGSGLGWIASDPKSPGRFYVSGEETVYRTEDGAKFLPIGGPRVAGCMACDSQGRLYLAAYRGKRPGLWRYAAGKWTRLKDDYCLSNVAVDPTNPKRIAVCANDDPFHDHCRSTGVSLSADGGETWFEANGGLSMLRGHAIAFDPFDPEQIVYGSLGAGFFRARWTKDYRPEGSIRYVSTVEDEAFAAPHTAANLLRNGTMTEGEATPKHWEEKWGEVDVRRDAKVFSKGPASLCVETAVRGSQGQAFQTLEGLSGKRILVRGYVKSEGDVKVNVAVQSFDPDWKQNQFDQVKYLQGAGDWTDFRKEVTIPAWAARCHVLLLVEGKGKAWLDEVSAEEVEGK